MGDNMEKEYFYYADFHCPHTGKQKEIKIKISQIKSGNLIETWKKSRHPLKNKWKKEFTFNFINSESLDFALNNILKYCENIRRRTLIVGKK